MSWQHSPHLQTLKLFGLIVGISLAAFYLLQSVLIPVIISFTLYALFRPAVDYLVRQDLNHSLSILLVLLDNVVSGRAGQVECHCLGSDSRPLFLGRHSSHQGGNLSESTAATPARTATVLVKTRTKR